MPPNVSGMALSPQWLDELRARVTLSTVIMRTDKLQKAGREWKACCPFHDEKSPSFTVNDQKGFYHCFGCGAHGDVIRWMTDQRGMGFMDAVKELAAEAGMEVPAPDPVAAKKAEKRASLIDVTTDAQQWFMDNLRSGSSAEVREAQEYLKGRGLTRKVLDDFGFGYAPENKQALAGALSKFDETMLVETGMRIATDDGTKYDRFRGRIMLPIQDARGRVIAFGGRILGKREGIAKYLNSPDTPLFDKGRTLYNLHRASPASRQTYRVIVVEGYMDVVALAQAGFEDAVAPLGTALTEMQLEMLWRMVEVPTLCFDGDNAGQKAAMRAIGRALPMLAPGRSLNIVRLPSGMDPDDLIAKSGPQAMEKLLNEPASLLETLWQFERDAQPLDSPEAKAGLKKRLLDHVDTIGHGDIAALYRRELLDRYSAFAFPPREQRGGSNSNWRGGGGGGRQGFGKPRNPTLSAEARGQLQRAMSGGMRDALSRAVIAGLVRHPNEISRHSEALTRLAQLDPKTNDLVESLFELAETLDSGGTNAISGGQGLPAPPDDSRYAFLREGTTPSDASEELAEAVSLLVERPALDAALLATIARFDEDPEGSMAEQARLRQSQTLLNDRLKAFGRRKAAQAATTDLTSTPDDDPASDFRTD